MASYQSPAPAAVPTSGGFKLKLKLGGSSASASAPPAAPVTVPDVPVPAPAAFSPRPPLPAAPAPAPAHAPASVEPPQPTYVGRIAFPGPAPSPAAPVREERPAARVRTSRDDERADAIEARGVSAHKYRELKRKHQHLIESRDETALALFRAQKLIVRLREDKSSLLDRVLMLETAAGLTADEVSAVQEVAHRTDRERDFPLLHPPTLPSLDERLRALPELTTSTDLTTSAYNAPLGPPPIPLTCPPRDRSAHITAAVAAQKLRDSNNARRIARGLPSATFPAVAVLGLEGSAVAELVERALAGEQPAPAPGGPKRRRESSGPEPVVHAVGTGGKGKGRAHALQSVAFLPNPFAGAGATPEPHPAATTAAPNLDVVTPDLVMDEDHDVDGDPARAGPSGSRKHPLKADLAGATKTRRVKSHGVTSGTFPMPFVQRNPDGSPVLPLALGVMVLKKLGVICPRPHYSTERYIFPIGFETTRRYPSMIDRTDTVEYVCRIVDGGNAPRFEIAPSDQPGVLITAGTPTGAWTQVVKAANLIRQRNHSNSVSGPEYTGLAHNVVKALIQELPGARASPAYIWQHFVEEPNPALVPSDVRRALPAGVSKGRVVGKKRKTSAGALKTEDGDEEQSHLTYSDTAYSRSSSALPGSLSPQAAPPNHYSPYQSQPDPPTAPIASLVTNPYDLPPPVLDVHRSPSIPTYSPTPYDPYSLPPPQYISANPYESPPLAGGLPVAVGGANVWAPSAPWFDDQVPPSALPGMPSPSPYGALMNRVETSKSNGSV